MKVFLMSFSLAVGLFLIESILQIHSGGAIQYEGFPEYLGPMDQHPVLGMVFHPHSEYVTTYPRNPHKYFTPSDSGGLWLQTNTGNYANLRFTGKHPFTERLENIQLNSHDSSNVQLNESYLKVISHRPYRVQFETRADMPRKMLVGFARSCGSWEDLGLGFDVSLDHHWKHIERDFIALDTTQNGRIYFNVGESNVPVEIANIKLIDLTTQRVQEPYQIYSVKYRFNALGCRGPDYSIPGTPGTKRILVLGDSYTLGIGVNEQDTFEYRLQQTLNRTADSEAKYEVINCGVFGYSTRDERNFYHLYGSQYEPDLVILVMVWNDDESYLDQVAKGYIDRKKSKWEHLFYTYSVLQDYLHRRHDPNYQICLQQVLLLNSEVRKNSSKLAVVLFRDDPNTSGRFGLGKYWKNLERTMRDGLKNQGVPILDLREALYENHSETELQVDPIIDTHPNNIAHGIAAISIFHWLKAAHLNLH